MKKIIKKYYTTPTVDSTLLQSILATSRKTDTTISFPIISALVFGMLLLGFFIQYFVHFNISYFDINASIISGVSLPLFILSNIAISLVSFIYTHMFFLLMMVGLGCLSSFGYFMRYGRD